MSSVFSLVYLSGHKYPRSPFSFLLLIVIRPNYSLLEYLKISCQIFNHSYSLCKTCITTFLHSLTLRKKSVMVCDLFGPRLRLAIFEFVLRTFQPYSYLYGGGFKWYAPKCLSFVQDRGDLTTISCHTWWIWSFPGHQRVNKNVTKARKHKAVLEQCWGL